jgi:hypothetical protein
MPAPWSTSAIPSAAALRTPPLPSTNASRGRALAGMFVTFESSSWASSLVVVRLCRVRRRLRDDPDTT